jgi:thymidine kinase
MFIEPYLPGTKRGWIEVICGSMFSGKTEELIRRLRRSKIANQQVEIFKPAMDVRYSEQEIVSHNATAITSTPIDSSQNILLLAQNCDVVGIDEAQFFDNGLPEVCETLALRGVRVVVGGLDLDYLKKPFGPMPSLLAMADYITKLHAICVQCGNIANYSYRKVEQKGQVMLGEMESYEPRCRYCYEKGSNV